MESTDDIMFKHDPDQPPMHGWHLDKRVSVSHIFATLSAFFALGSFIWALDGNVKQVAYDLETHKAVTKIEIEAIKESDRQSVIEMNRHYAEIMVQLNRIETKLERHSESVPIHKGSD